MVLTYPTSTGRQSTGELDRDEVRARFTELTQLGMRGFADTRVDEPVGPLTTVDEAEALGATEVYFVGQLAGG